MWINLLSFNILKENSHMTDNLWWILDSYDVEAEEIETKSSDI